MATIYDNIQLNFEHGLRDIITNNGVERVDFCVGYFNLRGWGLVVDHIDNIPGGEYCDVHGNPHRCKCRLLIGMHHTDEELVRMMYSERRLADANLVAQCKRQIAQDFRQQLLIGNQTRDDETPCVTCHDR